MTGNGGDLNFPTDPEDIAREHAPDLVPEQKGWGIDRWLDDASATFQPGLFIHNNVVYITRPILSQERVNVGTKAKPDWKDRAVLRTLCVTSDRDYFLLTEEEVNRRGFLWDSRHFTSEHYLGWSQDSIRQFLADQTEEPDPMDLFLQLRSIWEKHVEYGHERHFDIMPLFIMLSYVFQLFKAMGYIHFHGTAGAGKSQNLNLIKGFALNCLWSSSSTGSSIFREIASSRGTILVDEAENWESESQQELLRIVKGGYTDGAIVSRTERAADATNWTVRQYATYSPKVIASIAPQDNTLTTRCIVITMRPAIRRIELFDPQAPQWQPIRDQLFLWAMYHGPKIAPVIEEWQVEKRDKYAGDIQNRPWQVVMPYLVLADYIGGETLFKPIIDFFAEYYVESAKAASVVDRTRLLLRALPRVLAEKTHHGDGYYAIKDIHDVVAQFLDEDTKDQYKIRSASRALTTLGFKDIRPNRQTGNQVRLAEDEVRLAFSRWRVEPHDEDRDWLEGNTDYSRPAALSTTSNLWQLGDTEDGDSG